ncbi:hypothetical protein TSUD_171450 [Trifolium subterraneum]|uniref:Uncharacterized protein n=1 Tax=Trifolium subterraneum TaxID=3900 RepID=A0A2Z6LNT9_TRISU|nr:hypothetical protein TSUD_171450 [Trifolium subterraneum]
MFPSWGLLNVNAQPSVHFIHQRLQEFKQNAVAVSQSSRSSSSNHPKAEEIQNVESNKNHALIEMHGFADILESEATQLEAYDPNDHLNFSTSI